MRFVFVDIAYGYTADRPDTDAPLGGTTSAICFLARALVKEGANCSFFNRIAAPAEAHGIRSLPLDRLVDELKDPDISAVIFCGRWIEGMVRLVRESTPAPLIAWMHESSMQTKLTPPVDVFDGVVFVSEWQQRVNQPFIRSRWQQTVIRNAMNPAAENLFAPGEAILAVKEKPPILFYAGGAARGAMHLPAILDALRSRTSDFTMKIFCNTDPSGDPKADKQYIDWLHSLPNVTHVGMVGQQELLQHMKKASFFVSPNPWPETSCISLIEAMAAGLSCVTTNRAALPETAAGFAQHVAIESPDELHRFYMQIPSATFADKLFAAMQEWQADPTGVAPKLRAQVDFFLAHYRWEQRVRKWIGFVEGLSN